METAAAGGTKLCSCGQTVPVPRLSELKRLAGHAPEAIRPSDQIRHLLLHGGLPPDSICRFTQRPTSDVVYVTVVCELPKVMGHTSWWRSALVTLGAFAISIWLLPMYLIVARGEPEVVGDETVFRLPVPVAADRQAQFRELSPAELRQYFCSIPLYARLLEEYPLATLSVCP